MKQKYNDSIRDKMEELTNVPSEKGIDNIHRYIMSKWRRSKNYYWIFISLLILCITAVLIFIIYNKRLIEGISR